MHLINPGRAGVTAASLRLLQAIYTSEEEVLKTRMKGLMEKVEDYTVRIKKLEDDASDIKTLLARKTEVAYNETHAGATTAPKAGLT